MNRHARLGSANGRYAPALERFAKFCRFEPTTGCVLWIGGTSAGRGNSARYGRFYDGKMWYAHRWSAIHIHGLALGEKQAGHNCPCGPNTLCVQHLSGQTQLENLDELNTRLKAKAVQSASERQFYLFISLGIEPAPAGQIVDPHAIPFYEPPEWLKPFMLAVEKTDDCPF